MKYFFKLLLFMFLFVSCQKEKNYVIEGKISGLSSNELQIIFSDSTTLRADTIFTNDEGKFSFRASSDNLRPVVIYMDGGNAWMTVWAQNKDHITISGDVKNPELILGKGGKTNDLIAQFKTKNKKLLTDKWDLVQKTGIQETDSTGAPFNTAENNSKLVNLEEQLKNKVEDFIKANPTEIASLVLIQDYLIDSEDPARVRSNLKLISGEAKESLLYQKLAKVNQEIMRTSKGNPAPDFTMIDIKKDTLSLDSFKDKHLLLSFSASWCPGCINDLPEIDSLYSRYKKDSLEIVSISFDANLSDWERISKEHKIAWKQIVENEGWDSPIVALYNVTNLPTYIFIDKNSLITFRTLDIDELDSFLNSKIKD